MAENEAIKWYVVHTYSGYENKVKVNLEKAVENNGMQDKIVEVCIPVEEAVEIKNNKRCSIYYAYALALTGRLKESEDILCGNGNLIIPDIRECETITSDLWFYIQSQKENPSEDLPRDLDFRMFVERDN